ncbi:NUDIX hydrolase [Streptomyces sp. NPDC006798]|uniref:NUDIX hydrolase n=1 Tax=Streptomyces sp. NPDC006798 TaxID=3155462 RepID=UPI0033F29EA4
MTHQTRLATVALAVVSRDQWVLLVRRRVPEGPLAWQFPGGVLLDGEPPEAGAVRETLEETGVSVAASVDRPPVIGTRTHPDTGCPLVYVACDYLSGEPYAASPREVDRAAWVPHDAIPRYIPQGIYSPVLAYLRSREALPVRLAEVTADASLARAIAHTGQCEGPFVDSLRGRLREYITALADPAERYGEGLSVARHREVILGTIRHARQIATLPDGEGDPVATLILLAGGADDLVRYVTTAGSRL